MYKNIRDFIEALERAGELVRVKCKVDPQLEITEIVDRMAKSDKGGKAIVFENTGTDFPILVNMFGSHRRIAMALGVDSLDEITVRIDNLLHNLMSPKQSLGDKLRMLPLLGEMSQWLPKTVSGRGDCQQVVLLGDNAKLSLLPILKCWPCDGGRFVTLPLVNTIDPDSGARNVGMYRMQITGEHTTGMHWHLHKTGERHYRSYAKRGEIMPVSVCLGGDPTYTYAATAPMPDNMDEYLLAGFLRRKPVRLVKSLTNDIYVPSDCDFVIEGFVDPSQSKFIEGPFGDHTGFYSLEDMYPEFHVTAITHRRDAVYPATVVGIPPQEDAYIAKATEKIFLAPIRLAMQPEVRDLYMPEAGTAHNIAIVDIDRNYAGQPYKVASSMWGAGQMMFNKLMLVTSMSEGESVRNVDAIASLLRKVDVKRNVMFSRGVYDILDHTTATMGEGGKLMIDATDLKEEREIVSPELFVAAGGFSVADCSLLKKWSTLILRADPLADIDVVEFLKHNGVSGVNFVIVADGATTELNGEELLWIVASNIDPQRDVKEYNGSLIADARSKIGVREGFPDRFPNVVTSAPQTIALVDRRWSEYGLGEFLPSPSRKYRTLLLSDNEQA